MPAVADAAPTITLQPVNGAVRVGHTTAQGIVATGSGQLNYQWQEKRPGVTVFTNIPGATNALSTFGPYLAADDGTKLQCVITDNNGSTTSTVINMHVVPELTIYRDTTEDFHIGIVYDYSNDLSGLPSFVDLGIGANAPHKGNAPANPFPESEYLAYEVDGTLSGSLSSQASTWASRGHSDWLVYDSNHSLMGDFGDAVIDISNPAVRDWFMTSSIYSVAWRYGQPLFPSVPATGIFWDDFSLGDWGKAYTNNNSTALGDGSGHDPNWPLHMINWAADMYARQLTSHPANSVEVNMDISVPGETFDSTYKAAQSQFDLVFSEGGFTEWGTGNSTDSTWLTRVEYFENMEAQNKALFINAQVTASSDAAITSAEVNWVLANYLLVKGKHTYTDINFDAADGTQHYGYYYDRPEYHARVGHATSARYAYQNVWRRDYSAGMALVNPSSSNTYNVTLGGSYTDLYGKALTSVSLAPASGIVLLSTGAAPTPVINSFVSTPSNIVAGNSTTLNWSVTGAVSVSISPGIGTVTGSSMVTVSPTATTAYTLTATNAAGSVTASATVTVGAAAGSPNYVQSVQNKQAGVAGSTTSMAMTGTTHGNLLVVGITAGDGLVTSVSDTQGNTFVKAVALKSSNPDVELWYAQNIVGGNDTITVNGDANTGYLWASVLEYSGIATSNALDVTASASGSGPSANSGSAPATTQANELVIGIADWAVCQPNVNAAAGAGFTGRQTATCLSYSDETIIEDQNVVSRGSFQSAATGAVSSDSSWISLIATFKTAGSPPPPAPAISSPLAATGTTGTAFSYQIAGTNNPTSFGATGLPSGLAVNASGLISGKPSASGVTPITISATNAAGTGSATLTLTVTTPASPPVITSALAASGTSGKAFTYQIAGTNTPTSFAASGLPSALTVNTANGMISGTPASSGVSHITISATNSAGTGSATLTLTVGATTPPVPVISSSLSASATVGTPFSYQIAATNSPTSFAASGLPAALSVNAAGLISGTPAAAGTSHITVSATNAGGTGTAVLTLTVGTTPPPPGIKLIQSHSSQGSAVAALSTSFTNNNAAGNLIVAFVRMSSTTQTVTMHDSAGNTYTEAVAQVQNADGHQVHVFYAKNITANANRVTATFSAANNHPWLAVYEYSGLNKNNPLDLTASAQGNDTIPNIGGITPASGDLIFAGTGLPASYTGSETAGSGYNITEKDTSTSPAANEAAMSAGNATGTFQLSTPANWSAVVATFRP